MGQTLDFVMLAIGKKETSYHIEYKEKNNAKTDEKDLSTDFVIVQTFPLRDMDVLKMKFYFEHTTNGYMCKSIKIISNYTSEKLIEVYNNSIYLQKKTKDKWRYKNVMVFVKNTDYSFKTKDGKKTIKILGVSEEEYNFIN